MPEARRRMLRCEICRWGGAKKFEARPQFSTGMYVTGRAPWYCKRHRRFDPMMRIEKVVL